MENAEMDVRESESELISLAQNAVSQCNWTVGECAAKWTKKYARGRTDSDFGTLVGLSADQVYQRRRVWEEFAESASEYAKLRWSHFYVALNWDDAQDCLQWANDNETTVAEMKVWRRLQHGEELSDEPLEDDAFVSFLPPEPTPVRDVQSPDETRERPVSDRTGGERSDQSGVATVTTVARDVENGAGDYAPFRSEASSPAPKSNGGDVAVANRPQPTAEQVVKRLTTSLERCNKMFNKQFATQFKKLPEKTRNRFIKAVGELSSNVANLM